MAEVSMKILVINQNKNSQFLPHAAQYQLFSEWDSAIFAAKLIGWEDPFGMGVDEKIGMGNLYQCGDIKITLIALDEQ
jgi:hypothetical protein